MIKHLLITFTILLFLFLPSYAINNILLSNVDSTPLPGPPPPPPCLTGAVDAGFNPNANGGVYTTDIQSDGKILIGGVFTQVGGIERNRIARLNTDGTLDAGFNPNASNVVYITDIQSDGKILIGGVFTQVGGIGRNRIARIC